MDFWNIDLVAEARRTAIRREMDQIHLEEQALSALPARGRWMGRGMVRLADWMISTGRDLRCRYDFESVDCGRTVSSGLAR